MFLDKLGEDYASNLGGTYMLHDGRPVRIDYVTLDEVKVRFLDTGGYEMISPENITGWKSLKYPQLGYRRLANGLWGRVHRAVRSYDRGLTDENMNFSLSSACLHFFHSMPEQTREEWSSYQDGDECYTDVKEQIASAALLPNYDDKDVFSSLLKGQATSFIPSHKWLVEKHVSKTGMFSVYMNNMFLGNTDARLRWAGPAKNQTLFEGMVNRYGR